jgi:2,3-bisphosphoglycerate-independent phosphoglycerate mutase
MSNIKKAILIIMDGWGLGAKPAADAIVASQANKVKALYSKYPHTTLTTFGEEVGLPEGQMGNSEVGHLNLGAGRIVYQELQRINVAIRDKSIFKNEALQNSIQYVLENNKALHLMGLVSDGGVHSHINHLIALVNHCVEKGLQKIYIHAFTDGRDTDPKSGLGYINALQLAIKNTPAKIASIIGRYYAMDRDKRWERVALAYKGLVNGEGEKFKSAAEAINNNYEHNITDEFIKPCIITNEQNEPIATIKENDAVLCFNFRTDRCREITTVLTQTSMPEFGMETLKLHYTTITEYDASFKGVHVMFTNDNLINTIGEVVANAGLKQIRIAETEKYPHVTFFFSGGREEPFAGEKRILKPSPKVATYDLQPEMSAYELTDAIVPEIENKSADFICLNFANTDMVGHTGVWEAAQKAARVVDECVDKIINAALNNDYGIFLLADHGNADFMINDDGTPNTAHTTNPVPFLIISNANIQKLASGKLADIAPTILNYMGLTIPKEMTGNVLNS